MSGEPFQPGQRVVFKGHGTILPAIVLKDDGKRVVVQLAASGLVMAVDRDDVEDGEDFQKARNDERKLESFKDLKGGISPEQAEAMAAQLRQMPNIFEVHVVRFQGDDYLTVCATGVTYNRSATLRFTDLEAFETYKSRPKSSVRNLSRQELTKVRRERRLEAKKERDARPLNERIKEVGEHIGVIIGLTIALIVCALVLALLNDGCLPGAPPSMGGC